MGGQVGKERTRSRESIPGFQQDALEQLIANATNLVGSTDPSTLAPGFTPLQQQGQSLAIQQALGLPTGGLLNAFSANLNAANPFQNPALASTIAGAIRPLAQTFQEVTLPGIVNDATAAGQFRGDSRSQIAQGIAARGFQDTVGDVVSRILSNAYGQGLQARTNTLGLAPTVFGAALQPGQTLQDIGALQQAQQQAEALSPFQLQQLFQGLIGSPIELTTSRGDAFSIGGNFGGSGGAPAPVPT